MKQSLIYMLQIVVITSSSMLYRITAPIDHAEAPTWDTRRGVLYYVDIHAGNIHSFEFTTGEINSIHLNGEVAPVVPSKNDPEILLVGVNRTVAALEWDGKSNFYKYKPLRNVSDQFPTSRFNDGKADKQGRLWFGTMGFEDARGVTPNQGLLYKIDRKNVTVMIAPVNVSNGLTWNRENTKFYYIDSPSRKVMVYDFNLENGTISNGTASLDLTQYPSISGVPDGMTIDKDDNLWIALFGGGAVIQFDPKSRNIVKVVPIPAEDVTSVAWGGPNFDILFVTTSRFRLSRQERLKQPVAGSVFAVTGLGASGREDHGADIVDTLNN